MPLLRPPFAEFPSLTTARLHLRALTAADVPQILPISFFEGQQAHSLAEAAQMQAAIWGEYAKGTGIHWGIALRADPAVVVGTCGFYRGFAGDMGEIGYVLLPAFRGQGYATEAARALARLGCEVFGLREVIAYTDLDNAASMAVLRRAGFRETPSARPHEARRFTFVGGADGGAG